MHLNFTALSVPKPEISVKPVIEEYCNRYGVGMDTRCSQLRLLTVLPFTLLINKVDCTSPICKSNLYRDLRVSLTTSQKKYLGCNIKQFYNNGRRFDTFNDLKEALTLARDAIDHGIQQNWCTRYHDY